MVTACSHSSPRSWQYTGSDEIDIKILRAAARIANTQFKRRTIPEVQAYFSALAPFQDDQSQAMMSDIPMAVDTNTFMFTIQIEEP